MDNLTYSSRTDSDTTKNGSNCQMAQFQRFLNDLLVLSKENQATRPKENGVPLFIFVSKKGYWLYRLIEQSLRESKQESPWIQALDDNTIEVKSDRYFTKMVSLVDRVEELSNRWVYVVDDFLIRGYNISRFCSLIEKVAPDVKPIPVVYKKWDGFCPNKDDQVFSRLHCFSDAVSLQDIGRLSIQETQEFHRAGIPYVIDLPFLKSSGTDKRAKSFFSIELTKDQFHKLMDSSSSIWLYKDTSYSISDYPVKSCFFYCDHDLFLIKFRHLIQNLVVECIYDDSSEDDKVFLTLTPFAILRSIRQDELICRFRIAFSGTVYGDELFSYLKKPEVATEDEKLNTALYRAIVFFFSYYVSLNFKKHLKDQCGVEIDLDTDELQDHWSTTFIESLPSVFGDRFKEQLNQLYKKNDIIPYAPVQRGGLIRRSDDLYYNIFAYFAFKRMANQKQDDFCSLEELEIAMADCSGYAVDDLRFKEKFTLAILQLLSQGVISNHISFDSDMGVVQRGFRSGENSTLLLPFNQGAIFKAIYTYYYQMRGKEIQSLDGRQYTQNLYYKYYSVFRTRLTKFIKDSELDSYLDMRQANDILSYFGEIEADALKQQIENKDYVIRQLKDSNSTEAKVAQLLEQYVLRMNFE